jgi:hypothetical protein
MKRAAHFSQRLRHYLIGLLSLPMCSLLLAASPQLIEESEARLYEMPVIPMSLVQLTSDLGGPEILLVKPDLSSPLQSPVGLQIIVVPKDGTKINWQSVQLLYGSLRFNITDRFLKIAQRDKDGYLVKAMNMPQGSHRLLILIQDSNNRTGRRELVFSVSGESADK